MYTFAREQQPRFQPSHSSTQPSPMAAATTADVKPHSIHACACGGGCPGCEAKINRKRMATSEAGVRANSPVGSSIGSLIDSSRPSGPLPGLVREKMAAIPGETLQRIRIHDDHPAHEAAQQLNARAFTIGSSVYFGRGEYRPSTREGQHILAHEAAHAHQQANSSVPPKDQLIVSEPSSQEERSAESFASSLSNGRNASPPSQVSSGSISRLMRVTFEATAETPKLVHIKDTLREVEGKEGEAFKFGWGPDILFKWSGTVTMHGKPETGSDWRVGMLQTSKDYWLRIWWSYHPKCTYSYDNAPVKDSKTAIKEIRDPKTVFPCARPTAEEPWFDYCTKSKPFSYDGEPQTVSMEDSPGSWYVPYRKPSNNQVASGIFDYGATFYAYLSAYNSTLPKSDEPTSPESGAPVTPQADEPKSPQTVMPVTPQSDEPTSPQSGVPVKPQGDEQQTAASAAQEKHGELRHLKVVYWQTMMAGEFNGNRAVGERLKVTQGGLTEAGAVQDYTENSPKPQAWGLTSFELIAPNDQCIVQDTKKPEEKK